MLVKQQLKSFYGNLTDRKIINLYKQGKKLQGNNGTNFLKLLEGRFDTILFRSKFGITFEDVRQLITQCHFFVNNKLV